MANAQANARRLQLQSELSTSRGTRTGLQSRVRELEAEARAEIQRIRATNQGTLALGRQGQQVSTLGKLLKGNMNAAQEFGAALRFAFGPQMAGFATAGVIYQIIAAFAEANREIEKLLRGLNAITGGQGDVYFDRLTGSAEKLGLPIRYVSQSFLALNAATKNTSLEGLKTQELFEALGNALSTTGANAVQFERGFRAMGQILAKDQLFAEELRQQLGEQLPTAIQDFARALKISPAELFKFMEQGVIKGDNLRRTIVLVSKEWKNTYQVLERSKFTVDQKLALLQNQMLLLFKAIGDTGIWRAFGDVILYVEGILSDAKNGVQGFAGEITALSRTIGQFASDVKNDLGALGGDIKNALSNVEFSPTGLIRNFKFLFESLPREARIALQPIEDAVANIDFSKIVVGAVSVLQGIDQGIGVFVASTKDLFETLGRQITLFDQVPVQLRKVIVEGLKAAFNEASSYISIIIENIKHEFNRAILDIKRNWKEIFGTNEEVKDVLFKIRELDKEYKKSTDAIKERSKTVDDSYNKEVAKLKEMTAAITREGANWKARTKESFEGIADVIGKNFERLAINRELEKQNILLAQATDREKQRSLFHKEYLDNLRTEARAKNPLLVISKEQAKLEQDKLKLSQAYNESLLEVSVSQYKRWAAQGQITQEAADFFEKSAKDKAAYDAWTQSQDAVSKYNEEVKKGVGANEQEAATRKDTLDALREQANEQLTYAAAKARELGNANRLKKIYEDQTALIESQTKLSKDYQKVLKNAEIQSNLKSPTKEEAKASVDEVQKNLDEVTPKPTITVSINTNTLKSQLNSGIKQVQEALPDGISIPLGKPTQESVQALVSEVQTGIDKGNYYINFSNDNTKEQVAALSPEIQNSLNAQGYTIKIDKVDVTDTEGWNRQLNRLTIVKPGLEFTPESIKNGVEQIQQTLTTGIPIPFGKPTPDSMQAFVSEVNKVMQQVGQVPITAEPESLTQLQKEINDITQSVDLFVDGNTDPAYEAVNAAIADFNSRTATIKVFADIVNRGSVDAKRLGGPIPGYGGGDRLHYLLEPGEFVLRKEAARSIGIGQLEQMNRLGGKFRSPLINNVSIPRMASGGEVTGAPIVINVPGQKSIRLSGSRDQAVALANLLTSVGRAA